MADFTNLFIEGNNGSLLAPAWVNLVGVGREIRHSDSPLQKNVASANWPATTRPAVTSIVPYTYAYSADAVGDGFLANGGNAPAWSKDLYLFARWNWDNVGTFGSAPIHTAYPTSAHGGITRGDGSILGGSADTKPGASAFSYLKGNAWGRVASAGAPAAGPANAPAVTDGTVGALAPAAGANWLVNFQSLQGDNDWIAFPGTPAATTADLWYVEFALFMGPNEVPGLYTPVTTLKYTFT